MGISANSTAFNTTTLKPLAGWPRRVNYGPRIIPVDHTVATTEIDTIGDSVLLIPLPVKAFKLIGFWIENADLDSNGSPALDMDIVVSEGTGSTGQTIVLNAGTKFQAATTNVFVHVNTDFAATTATQRQLATNVVAAAATAASGSLKITAIYE